MTLSTGRISLEKKNGNENENGNGNGNSKNNHNYDNISSNNNWSVAILAQVAFWARPPRGLPGAPATRRRQSCGE